MIYQYTLAPIESILETVFVILIGISNSYFLSLVLLAILVRLATKPLEKYVRRAVTSQAEIESVLAPQIDEIKQKFTSVKRHEAIKRLYSRYAYHPAFAIRSLAGLGVQLPFFIAAYFMLLGYSQLNGVVIPVLGDLGKPDTLLFGSVHLMPIVMTLVNILALVTAPGFSRKNLIQGLFISLMFLILLYSSPLGLLIYWTTSNLFSLISNFAPAISRKLNIRKPKEQFKNTFIGRSFEEYAYLFFVTNLAIALPLLGVLGEQYNFFTAHSLPSKSIITLLLAISIVPALVLTVLRWASKRVGIVNIVDSSILFSFLGLFVFYTLNKVGYGFFPPKYEPYILLIVALLVTMVAVVLILKNQLMRFLSYLSLIIPMIFLNFLFVSPASTLFKSSQGTQTSKGLEMNDTPVFLLIFDEFSGLTLQNVKGQLDVSRYPGFAELAQQADYFPNALTSHFQTNVSIPSIVSGNVRAGNNKGLAPGENLIELFQAKGPVDAYSPILPADLLTKQDTKQTSLVSDFVTLYVYIIFHQDWIEKKIGAIPETWKGFGVFFKKDEYQKADQRLNPHERQFIDWMKKVDDGGTSSQFHFLHYEIPHAYYTTTSLGRPITNSKPILNTLLDHDPFVENAKLAHLNVIYHNYMQQSAYTDILLQEFIQVLKRKKLFDKSLIIVTSDHGVSYNRYGPSRRSPMNEDSWKNIVSVPLFIKYPNQKVGNVNTSFVTTLDLSNTILKVVGIDSPWESVGQDLNRIADNSQTRSVELTPKFEEYFQNIKVQFQNARVRKKTLFGEEDSLHTIAVNYTEDPAYTGLLTTDIAELTIEKTSAIQVRYGGWLNPQEISYFGTVYDDYQLANDIIIAAVVDGKIQAVFKSGKADEQDGFFAFSLPEKEITPTEFNVSLYEIQGAAPFRLREIQRTTTQKAMEHQFSESKQRYAYDWKESVLKSHGLEALRIGKNGIKVKTNKGDDPLVVFKSISTHAISEPIFHIELDSNQDQKITIYYQTIHKQKFHESQKIDFLVTKGSNSIYIKSTEKDLSGPFRIDFDQSQSTEVMVKNIEVRN